MNASRNDPAEAPRALIARIVACVRKGDDAALNALVRAFARRADLHDLFALRAALHADPPSRRHAPGGGRRTPC